MNCYDKEKKMRTNLVKTICSGIALAMGVAVIVTNIINPPSVASLTSMLAIAVIALGINAL